MDAFYSVLGIGMIYTLVHFTVIQFMRNWEDRTAYEKGLTVAAIVIGSLLLLSIMFES